MQQLDQLDTHTICSKVLNPKINGDDLNMSFVWWRCITAGVGPRNHCQIVHKWFRQYPQVLAIQLERSRGFGMWHRHDGKCWSAMPVLYLKMSVSLWPPPLVFSDACGMFPCPPILLLDLGTWGGNTCGCYRSVWSNRTWMNQDLYALGFLSSLIVGPVINHPGLPGVLPRHTLLDTDLGLPCWRLVGEGEGRVGRDTPGVQVSKRDKECDRNPCQRRNRDSGFHAWWVL
jgi:hypothetical protein